MSSVRFFRAGKGLSFRTGKFFGESAIVGVAAGFVVAGFRWLIDLGGVCLSDSAWVAAHRWTMLLLPALGALAGHLLIKRFSKLENARGTDSVVKAYHQGDGYITRTVIPVKSVASVLTVASGGSAGYEGPVTLIGAAVGNSIARMMNLTVRSRRILMAAGLAAGISALFQAPLAGAIFGFEIFYSSSDIEYETVLPCFVASALAYTVYAYFYGWQPLFAMAPCSYDSGLRLLPYFLLALVITFGARFYISCFRTTERTFEALRLPAWTKPALGGLAVGALGYFVYGGIYGAGYPMLRQTLLLTSFDCTAALSLLGFFLLNVLATSLTVGSGGSGGVFAPALVNGATLGAGTGVLLALLLPESFNIHPAAFALVGAAGFLASAIRTPLTAIVMVAEISGNHQLLVPAMWVCGLSFWLNNGWTLYRSQVHNRESSPVHA